MAITMTEAVSRSAADVPERPVAMAFILTALGALFLGFLLGPLQALNYAGIDLYQYLPLASYYQGLTLHGVLLALVFTTFFISGWLLYLPARELDMHPNLALSWSAFGLMLLGTILAGAAMLSNTANVLYTLYPPLQAHFALYLGLALVVVASLMVAYGVGEMWLRWRRAHPGEPTPLATYMSVVTWLMWALASLGLVTGVVGQLLPWSLGWTEGVDPQLFRTFFWYTGHPIVYFWVLPAYVSWYALLPRQAGGRLFSDPMARAVFLLFLLFSIPVGFHHQYSDPGISVGWKVVHNVMTMFVAVPSLITAFTVGASLEDAGRARGGEGLTGWFRALPWDNPVVSAQVLAMVTFIFGGAGGIILSSVILNATVHNTAFIPGHFHITVGTATTLTFMGIAYWLVPHLAGKPLRATRAARASVWHWFAGMMLFAAGMHWMGLLGVPRRTHLSNMSQPMLEVYTDALAPMVLTGIGGIALLIGGLLFFYAIAATLLGEKTGNAPDIDFTGAISGPRGRDGRPKRSVLIMDRLGLWALAAAILIAIAYVPTIVGQINSAVPVAGQRLW